MKSLDGIEVLRGRLKDLPRGPGVYRMLNEAGAVLYVGKANNIKARVTQYTQTERMGSRIRKMVFETRELVTVETATEVEALLLEANLIKSLKPKYNIIFRDDASYVSVVITDEEVPMVRSHRGAKKAKGAYFGPYPSSSAVYATLDLMERAFRLRSCSDSVFRNRTRPCLKYDIKRCSAPCVGKIAREDYLRLVGEAARFMRGEREGVLKGLQAQMEEASAAMRFEEAAVMRDRIKAISAVTGVSTAVTHGLSDADVFAIVGEHGRMAVQGFFYRGGQHVGNQVYHVGGSALPLGSSPGGDGEMLSSPATHKDASGELAEALRVFLAMHYAGRVPPPYIYCNVAVNDADTLAEALGIAAGRRIRIETPQRGEKKEIVARAELNALSALRRKRADGDGWAKQMAEFGAVLGRDKPVGRVECYDISNISGRFPVASLVVAGPEGMEKDRYRKYAVKTKDTPDDYAMLREVLGRRVLRGLKDHAWPDVMMVDGGKGQLNVLVAVMREAGLLGTPECPCLVGIAKGEERDKGLETMFLAELKGGEVVLRELPVAHGSALIFMLQRVRDEAHRFAIGFHRQKRGKSLTGSKLDDIPGVGPGKKKALLLHFGSVEGVRGASLKELARVPGIGEALAEIVYGHFHS